MSSTPDMTPEQATAALVEMTAAYKASQPVTPRDKLSAFAADKDKQAKLAAGNVEVQREFDELAQAHAAFNAPEKRDQAALGEHLSSVGLSRTTSVGDEVAKYISGELTITPQLRAEVDARIQGWKRDPEFMKKLFDGDPEATRLLNIASAMRLAPIKGEAA